MFVKGVGRTHLSQETAVELDILRISPFEASSISEEIDSDIRGKLSYLFNGVGLLKGYELKLRVDESVKPVAQQVRVAREGQQET